MNILEALMGEKYPKLESAIYADGSKTEVDGKLNGISHLKHLVAIATTIGSIAEDKLSEPEAIKNIGLDCKPFIDNEPEETQANA